MKFIALEAGQYIFQTGKSEKQWLCQVLHLYPLVGVAPQRISKTATSAEIEESQRMLNEALAEQRAENRRLLETMLNEPDRFRENQDGYRLALEPPQVEWLLQILNDIRLNCWQILGSPGAQDRRYVEVNERTAPYYWAMEMCAFFETALLEPL